MLLTRPTQAQMCMITPAQREEAINNFRASCDRVKNENNYSSLLSYLVRLDGRPFSLENYRPFQALYNFDTPEAEVLMCGRQVAKSTNLGVRGVLFHAVQPFLRSLYVLPLQEMARRLSVNAFKPLILQSPLKSALLDANCEMNVFQRTFRNMSSIYFSYAFLDCDRCRGFAVDDINYDEVQDMDASFIPIINEALSASELHINRYSGTPKTTDNTLNVLYQKSSRGEWAIPCGHCRHLNIPNLEFDILKMIGPLKNVSEYGTGLVCAKCSRPVDAKAGFWVHEKPELISKFVGYHVPQIILPLHYADVDKWRAIINKSRGDLTTYLNECLGIASDTAAKLVTEDNLKSAAVLDHQNELNEALAWSKNRYRQIFLGVDWGGGGVKEVSRTVVAVIGIRPGGKYETPYIEEFLASSEGHEQAARVLDLFSMFGATHIGHDYGGAGQNREDLLIQFGFPIDRLVPLAYVRATAQPMITTRSADGHGSRSYYAYDKTRSLLTLAEMIKTRLITFPQYQSCEALLKQFLALQNETTTPKRGGAFNLVTTPPDTPDDVPQAINFGLGAAYRVMDEYPNLAVAHQSTLSKVNLRIATPQSPVQQVYSDFAASDLGYRV